MDGSDCSRNRCLLVKVAAVSAMHRRRQPSTTETSLRRATTDRTFLAQGTRPGRASRQDTGQGAMDDQALWVGVDLANQTRSIIQAVVGLGFSCARFVEATVALAREWLALCRIDRSRHPVVDFAGRDHYRATCDVLSHPGRADGSAIPDRVGLYCGVLRRGSSGAVACVGRACVRWGVA